MGHAVEFTVGCLAQARMVIDPGASRFSRSVRYHPLDLLYYILCSELKEPSSPDIGHCDNTDKSSERTRRKCGPAV